MMDRQKLLEVLNKSLDEIDKRIYENLIVQSSSRSFSSRRSVEEILRMFELKKYMREMKKEYEEDLNA